MITLILIGSIAGLVMGTVGIGGGSSGDKVVPGRFAADKFVSVWGLFEVAISVVKRVSAAHDYVDSAVVYHLSGYLLVFTTCGVMGHEAGGGGVAELDTCNDTGGFAQFFAAFDKILYRFSVGADAYCSIISFDACGHSGSSCGGISGVCFNIVKVRPGHTGVIRAGGPSSISCHCQGDGEVLVGLHAAVTILKDTCGINMVVPTAICNKDYDVLRRVF